MSPLETAYTNIIKRAGWVEIVMPLLAPFLSELLKLCFDNGREMREGLRRLSFRQRMAINNTARQICVECGVRLGRRAAATQALSEAIEAEIKDALSRDAGDDLWQEAYDDAVNVN